MNTLSKKPEEKLYICPACGGSGSITGEGTEYDRDGVLYPIPIEGMCDGCMGQGWLELERIHPNDRENVIAYNADYLKLKALQE